MRLEFYGMDPKFHDHECTSKVQKCECTPKLLKAIGELIKSQKIQGVYNLELYEPIKNISYSRDNIGFEKIHFHSKNMESGDLNFLMTRTAYEYHQKFTLNPIHLMKVTTFS